jgi:hypothetical protein
MSVQFSEKMSGTWRRTDGSNGHTQAPLSFTATAWSPSARSFAHDGLLRLDGELHAGGLAAAVPCSGTLDIAPRARTLTYDLAFRGDDGHGYRFHGRKLVHLSHPIAGMTTLPGHILDERGGEVGEALLRFDLRHDLYDLVRSISASPPAHAAAAPPAHPSSSPAELRSAMQ